MAGAVTVRQRNQLEYFMAQYQEFTFDQGTNTSIELHLVDANGAAKNLLGHTITSKIKKTFKFVIQKMRNHIKIQRHT